MESGSPRVNPLFSIGTDFFDLHRAPVNSPLNQPPGKDSDREVTGAAMIHDIVTPTRWENPKSLIVEKSDYYEKLTPSSGEIHQIGRLYDIKVSFKEDGTASTSWKLRRDR